MGYRSNGKIYLSEKAQKFLTNDMKKDLKENWTKDEEHENVWSFYDWKWYTTFSDVQMWEDLIMNLSNYAEDDNSNIIYEDYDIVVVGEDGAINSEILSTCSKFSAYTAIDIIND